MAVLTDYLPEQTLRNVQEAFSAVAGQVVVICAPDGQPILDTRMQTRYPIDVPVELDGEIIGRVRTSKPVSGSHTGPAMILQPFHGKLLKLMANVLVEFCRGTMNRRRRLRQLSALHRMMATFNGPYELQDILDNVTQTVTRTLKSKASAIRLLSPDGKELLIRAVHSSVPQYLDKSSIKLSESQLDQEILKSEIPLYVADMRTDPRVIDREAAKHEGLVSALCAPLVYKRKPLGVLRVYSGEPRTFDWFERQMLQTIAGGAAAAIAGNRLYHEAVKSFRMKRQLATAGIVQRRMVPQHSPKLAGFDISSVYVPHQELAGDFFDFIALPEDNTGIAICDVVGKGVRASLLMASIRASLRAHASHVYDMSDVLGRVNNDLCAGTISGDFATMFYGVLNSKSKRLTYCCAGHLPPILIRGGKARDLKARGGLLGLMSDMDYPVDFVDLKSGDIVLAYTDGLTEATNFKDEMYGRARAVEALKFAASQGYSADSIIRYCVWDMRRFAGLRRRLDDLTLIAIKVL